MRYGVKCPVHKDSEFLVGLVDKGLDVKVLDCNFFIYLYGVVEANDEDEAKKKFRSMAEQAGANIVPPIEDRFDWVIFPVDNTEPEGIKGASDLDTKKLE